MILVVPMLIVNLVVVVQSAFAEQVGVLHDLKFHELQFKYDSFQVMLVIHLSTVIWSLAVRVHVEQTPNVNRKEDLPSVNVQEDIQEIHTLIVFVILVQLILVVCIVHTHASLIAIKCIY